MLEQIERFFDPQTHERKQTSRAIIRRVESTPTRVQAINNKEYPTIKVVLAKHVGIATGELPANATNREVALHKKEVLAAATVINSAQEDYERERARESAETIAQQIENAAITLAAAAKLVGRVGGALLVGIGEGVAVASVEALNNIIKRIDGPTAFILGTASIGSVAIPIYINTLTLSAMGQGALAGGIAALGITLVVKSAASKEVNTQPAKGARATQKNRNDKKRI